MYVIDQKTFYKTVNTESLINEIKKYLHNEKKILLDKKGETLNDKALIDIIKSNKGYEFKTNELRNIEIGFLKEMKNYLYELEFYINKVSYLEDQSNKINCFIDTINSLTELETAARYYNIDFYSIEEINEIANKAIKYIELNNIDYLMDVLEYEIVPRIRNFLEQIMGSVSNNELLN
ncbi:hypothetical protein [Jeotgalibacillus malaysiensis]|uniref:hypothetical protein n=1 Tax=Jeotgalibacillus malaysiensis TaxID=1508404 RepID=UPI0038516D13